jgi:WD40 repeat protein
MCGKVRVCMCAPRCVCVLHCNTARANPFVSENSKGNKSKRIFITGHKSDVIALHIFAPDNDAIKRVVSASAGGSIIVWKKNYNDRVIKGVEYTKEYVLRGHTQKINYVCSDGSLMVSSDEERIRIWDMFSGVCKHDITPDIPSNELKISALSVHSGHVAVTTRSADIYVWSMMTGMCLVRMCVGVQPLSINLENHLLFVAYSEPMRLCVSVWCITSGSQQGCLYEGLSPCITPTSNMIVYLLLAH